MSLQALPKGTIWFPSLMQSLLVYGSGTHTIDATGEKSALVFRAPKSGNLDRFDFNVAAVTNSPDNGLRASFQAVDATGFPDGTPLGATNNAFVTYAHTVTTGWKSTNFGEVLAVTRGDILAAVVDIPSFTAGDSVGITAVSANVAENFPYGISATNTKQGGSRPAFAMHYTDGYESIHPFIFAATALTSSVYNSGDATADERGLAFSFPFPVRIYGFAFLGFSVAGANFEGILYDSADTAVRTTTHDGDHVVSTVQDGLIHIPFSSAYDLAANTIARVTVRPTTANNVDVTYSSFASLEHMDTLEGGSALYMTTRLNQGGSWSNYNASSPGFRRPRIALELSALSDGLGGHVASRQLLGM